MTDNYLPLSPTLLSSFDNYEIYSLVVTVAASTEYRYIPRSTNERWRAGFRERTTELAYLAWAATHGGGQQTRQEDAYESSVTGAGFHRQGGFSFHEIQSDSPSLVVGSNVNIGKHFYMIQSFAPLYKIEFTALKNRMDLYPPKARAGWKLETRGNYVLPKLFEQTVNEFDWTKLAVNGLVTFEATALETGSLTVNYWAHNNLEAHPLITFTADHRRLKIKMLKGEKFRLQLNQPIAETLSLVTSRGGLPAFSEVSSTTLNKPSNIGEYLDTSSAYGQRVQSIYQTPPLILEPEKGKKNNLFHIKNWLKIYLSSNNDFINGGTGQGSELTLNNQVVGQDYPRIASEIIVNAGSLVYQELPALNDIWGHGRNEIGYPLLDSRLPELEDANTTFFDLFLKPQQDGSIGDLIMDSPRLLEIQEKNNEIHAALDAGKYAFFTDEDGQKLPRVTNIGWYIEKIGNILGLRRKPDGKYLDAVDQARYDRTRLNSPKWELGDYDLNSWGNKGYALRHLPTTYEGGQRQDNQYDLVHDLPQLLAAILDQIDLGQGLQHTAAIRLKVGKDVQSYQNVGQLTIDLAARVIEMEALVQKMAVMQIETSNSVRELFPGIGIPVATKSVSIDIGGKQQRIFYPGFQSGKGSILDNLSAIKVNLGIALGQLMPQKKPDSRWNPFDRKPKS
jgi:hypothetical protein